VLLDAFDPGFGAKLHGKFGEQPPRNPGAEVESGAARFFKGALALRRQRFPGVAQQCLRLALCLGAARFRRFPIPVIAFPDVIAEETTVGIEQPFHGLFDPIRHPGEQGELEQRCVLACVADQIPELRHGRPPSWRRND